MARGGGDGQGGTGLIWLVTRVGGWGPMKAGKGGRWGGGGAIKGPFLGSLQNRDEGGGMGGGVGRWPWRAGKGREGSVGATKHA